MLGNRVLSRMARLMENAEVEQTEVECEEIVGLEDLRCSPLQTPLS